MKKKTQMHLWGKRCLCMFLALGLLFGNMTILKAQDIVTAASEAATLVNPILKEYETADTEGLWQVTAQTRFVVEAAEENLHNDRLKEVIKLMDAEFCEKKIPSENPMPMVYAPEGAQLADDILVRLVRPEDITDKSESAEAYRIEISREGVVVKAASENAVIYALRTIQQLMISNGGMPYGTIVDYPDVEERRLHVDCARKFISKDWFIRQIREMSYLRMNTLQMHFSENLGFRIECETDPAIMSEQYLRKSEVREILAEAKKYGIKVIPSFDSPGHVDQILKAHPEYGQVNTSGNHYASGLDVTNQKAVDYIYSLYDEYMDLFEGCTDFHIGGDEYMEFDRAPFTTEYQSVLTNYAVQQWGNGYTWKDTLTNYINKLAEHVYARGFKPRVWNDGLYYGESSSPQKIVMHDYIGIDFWSQMTWNSSIARLQTFIDKGHKDIYNFNASYFYYVLRTSAPADGREQHSFDVLNQDQNIYNTWTPGKFQSNTIADDSPSIRGVSMGIWCDNPSLVEEDVIAEDIESALRALACKSWDVKSSSRLPWAEFSKLCDTLGHVAGYEKKAKLPDVGDFVPAGDLGKVIIHYVTDDGETLKTDAVKYGNLDTEYTIEAETIYGYRVISDASVSGTYSKTDKEITFVYEKYCDKSALKEALDGQRLEKNYIRETYKDYKAAYEQALQVYEDADSEQRAADDAASALQAAEEKLVELTYYALYVEANYPLEAGAYVSGYDAYAAAVAAGKAVLANQKTGSEEAKAALEAILAAKDGLQKADGITPDITAADGTYEWASWAGTYFPPETYAAERMIDNDVSTKAWFAGNQETGKTLLFTFPETLMMSAVRIVQPSDVGEDILENADVEVAGTDQQFEKVGTLNSDSDLDTTISFDKKSVKYVRILLRAGKENWYQIAEVYFTYDQPQEADDLEAMLTEAEELDTDNAQRSLVSDLADALIAAQQAYVSGKQDVQKVKEDLRAAIDALKNSETVEPADKTELAKKIEECQALKKEDYTQETWDVFETALRAAEEVLADTYALQADVDEVLTTLESAKEALKAGTAGPVDKSQLQAKVDACKDLDSKAYSTKSWAAFKEAYNGAEAVLQRETVTQKEIDAALESLTAAQKGLLPAILSFVDVKDGEWYYDAVADVNVRGLMTGLTDTIFGPGQDLVRAQFATILWRMEGSPEVEYTNKFPDVPDLQFYTKAVLWAESKGIVTGYTSNGHFGPSDNITREQMAVMMYRYAAYKKYDVTASKDLNEFPDGGNVQSFAAEAMKWCTAMGIITGDKGNLNPQGNTNRAMCAAIISRFVGAYE